MSIKISRSYSDFTPDCGVLYIVATPIGNLSDFTDRAKDTLRQAEIIVAEDTRNTLKLLKLTHVEIAAEKIISFHEHSSDSKLKIITDLLQQGKKVALVTDAGTPLISDPGYEIVKAAIEMNCRVISIPGCCALIPALTSSGLATDKFYFFGFTSKVHSHRMHQLESLKDITSTLIFYESPHRVKDFLEDAVAVFGADRKVVVAKELSKLYETFYYGTLLEVSSHFRTTENKVVGEYVVLISGNTETKKSSDVFELQVDKILKDCLKHLSLKDAVKVAQDLTGLSHKELYTMALNIK